MRPAPAGAVLVLLVAVPLLVSAVLGAMPAPLRDRVGRPLGVVVGAACLLLALPARSAPDLDLVWVAPLRMHFSLATDGLSYPLVLLTAGLTLLCQLHLLRVLPEPGRPGALVAVVLLLEAGTLGTFLARDLLLFFVFFETVLIPMYFLIAVWGGSGRGPAARTFLLYTVTGSVFLLLGVLLVGTRAGSFDLAGLAAAGGSGLSRGTQVLAFLAIGAGLAVKTPMWPLHTWLPDAHTAAPTVGSVLLAGVLLKMGVYGFARIAVPLLPEGAKAVAPFLGAFGVVGILWGALACLAQRELKRLIAFSSVGHMGFVLLGIASLTPAGINGAIFASVAHGLITGLLFFLAGAIKDRYGTGDLDELGGGLYARAPRMGGLLAFAAVASLGLPGLAGFWGEMLAMLGAWRPAVGLRREVFLVLAALAGTGAVLTAAYLLRMIRRIAQGVSEPRWARAVLLRDLTRHEILVWAPLVAAVLVLGLAPGLLLGVTTPAATAAVAAFSSPVSSSGAGGASALPDAGPGPAGAGR